MKKVKYIISYSIYALIFISALVASLVTRDYDHHASEEKVVLCGEGHGIKAFYDEELKLWNDFYKEGNRHLFVELPYYTAEYLNLWMKSSDDTYLDFIYDCIEGTLSHVPEYKNFLLEFKKSYPETVFHGTDVGHQYQSIGESYKKYLEDNNMTDTTAYTLTKEAINQGEVYYSTGGSEYRENKMYENFIREFDSIGNVRIMGIYGSHHTHLDDNIMMGMLKNHYGDIFTSVFLNNIVYSPQFVFGFSWMGLVFVLLLLIPNIAFIFLKPNDYDVLSKNENKILGIFEKTGEVLFIVTALIFVDFNPHFTIKSIGLVCELNLVFLAIALILMVMYEIYWIIYFVKERTLKSFYRDLYGLRVPGATLPVLVALALGLYTFNYIMIATSIILGIGHIGIHLIHKKEYLNAELI